MENSYLFRQQQHFSGQRNRLDFNITQLKLKMSKMSKIERTNEIFVKLLSKDKKKAIKKAL